MRFTSLFLPVTYEHWILFLLCYADHDWWKAPSLYVCKVHQRQAWCHKEWRLRLSSCSLRYNMIDTVRLTISRNFSHLLVTQSILVCSLVLIFVWLLLNGILSLCHTRTVLHLPCVQQRLSCWRHQQRSVDRQWWLGLHFNDPFSPLLLLFAVHNCYVHLIV